MSEEPAVFADPRPVAAALPDERRIALIANRKSGTNARDRDAITRATDAFGRARTRLYTWSPDTDIAGLVDRALDEGADTIIAAGGDGTAMAVAGAMVGRDAAFGVLPLGTFNFFARGLGLPEDPAEAARVLASARAHPIHVGTVNGRVFLNNASLGIYPAVLKMRESVYARYGRRRIMAHWSVVKSFLRFQRPMHLTIETEDETRLARTPLLFVSRSAYQLDAFGLKGAGAIADDAFAVLIARGETRADLFRSAARLVTRTAVEGRDYDLIHARQLTVHTRRSRALLAYDGEKARAPSPFAFRMSDQPLTILLPQVRPTA